MDPCTPWSPGEPLGEPALVRPGPVLLQGGAEMQPPCRQMDRELIGLAPDGPVVLLLGAATPGADHDRSAARASRYYQGLLPERAVLVAAHPQVDLAGCLAVVAEAAVVVLPGGSPSRLQHSLGSDGARLGRLLTERHHAGVALSGASAGAMVLCARTALPDSAGAVGAGGPAVVDGLGLVPGLAMVHDDGRDRGWRDPDDPDGLRWGLPEAGGVLVHGGTARAVGQGRPRVLHGRRAAAVPKTATALAVVVGPDWAAPDSR
jgi:cyanophycinase-like exopeptidase